MVRFHKRIDLRSRKAMTDFLINHFRYNTANSWNRSQSYACNLKIHRLGLDSEIVNKLFDMIQVQEFFYGINDLLNEFNKQHCYLWQAAMNGRSGGLADAIVNYALECVRNYTVEDEEVFIPQTHKVLIPMFLRKEK